MVDSLSIFAELSVAMLGFSGITAVLGNSQSDIPFIAGRIRGLLFTSGIAALASILPLTGTSILSSSYIFLVLLASLVVWSLTSFLAIKDYQASLAIGISCLGAIASAMIWLGYSVYTQADTLVSAYAIGISACLLTAGVFFIRVVLSMVDYRSGGDT